MSKTHRLIIVFFVAFFIFVSLQFALTKLMASQDFQTANVLDGVHLSVLKIMAVTKSGVTDVDI